MDKETIDKIYSIKLHKGKFQVRSWKLCANKLDNFDISKLKTSSKIVLVMVLIIRD